MSLSHADYRMAMRARALTLSVASATATFTRATTATYVTSGGVVTYASVDEARTGHYVGAVNTPLYESAATNLLRRSAAFDHAAWDEVPGSGAASGIVADSSAAPDLSASADTVGNARQLWTPASTGAHTFSVHVKDNSSVITDIRLTGKTDPTDGSTTNLLVLRLTWAAGVPTVTIFGGFGTALTTVALAGGWYRVAGYATVGTQSYYTAEVQASGGGTCFAWGAQVEAGTEATSYFGTTATTATRAGDGGVYGTTATGYFRAAGSFITDGFRAGMEVAPTGFTSTTPQTIKAVTALALTVHGTLAVQGLAASRSLAVGLPATRVWENAEKRPAAPTPYVGERYFPGTLVQDTIGPLGYMEATAIYQLDLYVGQDTGPVALDRYADALAVHFAPRTSLTTGDGTIVRVGMGSAGPTRSSVGKSEFTGYAVLSVSFPLVVRVLNTI